MRLILMTALALATGATQLAAEPAKIGFDDLRTVVRLDARLAEAELPLQARQRLEARREAARQALASEGFDIEALLAQRWTVAKQRKQALVATNPALAGAKVRLDGYLIPAGTGPDGRRIGYLVPVVGMCSHMPAEASDETIHLLDGEVRMVSLWRLDARVIEAEGPSVSTAARVGAIDPLGATLYDGLENQESNQRP